jgi:hypothetical protein
VAHLRRKLPFVLGKMIGVAVGLSIAALGVACLLRPAAIQDYVIRSQCKTWIWRINPFADWMRRPSYRAYLRFMGIFILLFAAIVIVGALHPASLP